MQRPKNNKKKVLFLTPKSLTPQESETIFHPANMLFAIQMDSLMETCHSKDKTSFFFDKVFFRHKGKWPMDTHELGFVPTNEGVWDTTASPFTVPPIKVMYG